MPVQFSEAAKDAGSPSRSSRSSSPQRTSSRDSQFAGDDPRQLRRSQTKMLMDKVLSDQSQDSFTRSSSASTSVPMAERSQSRSRQVVQSQTSARQTMSDHGKAALRLLFNPQSVIRKYREDQKLRFAALDASSPLGAYLDRTELQRLAHACSIKRFAQGKHLPESPFYIVLSGLVAAVSSGGDDICTRTNGAFFSREVAGTKFSSLLHKATIVEHTTALVCRRPTTVMLVTSDVRLDYFYELCSHVGKEGYDSIVGSNLVGALGEVPFLKDANVDTTILRKLGELCSYLALREGEYVFEQDERADCFYIVLKGGAEVIINENALLVDGGSDDAGSNGRDGTGEVGGITKGVGETFGVASLVLGAPTRHYGMVAVERSLFLVVSQENFEAFMHMHPGIEPSISEMTKRFLIRRYSKMASSIFGRFTDEELDRAVRHAEFVKVDAQSTVYSVGDEPLGFYVVAYGLLSRDYEDGSPSAQIPTGTYFGDLGVLLPRTKCLSTVVALQDTTLLYISKQSWKDVVMPPTIVSKAIASASLSKRDLQFTLQLDLLIKLQRAQAPLDAMLLHPKTQPELFEYAQSASRGGLRPIVYHLTFDILQRVAVFHKQKLSEETTAEVEGFLMEQVSVLAQLLAARPCPLPETVDEAEEAHGHTLDGLRASLASTSAIELELTEAVHEGTLRPADLKGLLGGIAKE